MYNIFVLKLYCAFLYLLPVQKLKICQQKYHQRCALEYKFH